MTTQEILAKVASGDIQPSEAATLIEALKSNGKAGGQLTYKVSSKGAVSVYGMGRYRSAFLDVDVIGVATAVIVNPQDLHLEYSNDCFCGSYRLPCHDTRKLFRAGV